MIKYLFPPSFALMAYGMMLGLMRTLQKILESGYSDAIILEGIAVSFMMTIAFQLGYPIVLVIHGFACLCIQNVKSPKSIYIAGLITGLVVNLLIAGNDSIEMLVAGGVAGFVAGWFYVLFRDTTVPADKDWSHDTCVNDKDRQAML